MPTSYAGNSANYPTSITLPSDGDGPGIKAADVNAGFEGLADRTANIVASIAAVDAAIDVRLDALEARRRLVDHQRAAVISPGLNVSLAHTGGPFVQTVTLLTAGVATQVGDVVEVAINARARLKYGGAATNDNAIQANLRANQNSTGDNDLDGTFRQHKFKAVANADHEFDFTIHGAFVIATAGTLVVKSVWFISPGGGAPGNAGDVANVYDYVATMQIWRS